MSSRSTQAPDEANRAFSLALDEFLNKLPDQNRKAFEAMKYINNDPQLPVSPNILVSEAKALDDLDKKDRSRRFGTRYLNIVRAFEGFFSVIDTVVSSNPTIAALVWGGIRFILTISTKYFGYFEFVTSTLETVAEDLYFYNDYATVLYSKWPRVENVLVRIYTNILKLCNHVLLPYAGTGGRLRDKLRMLSLVLRRLLGGGPVKAIARDLDVCRSVIEREVDHVDRKEAKEGRDAAQKEREAQASHRVAEEERNVLLEHRENRDMTDKFVKSINAVDCTIDHSKITENVSISGTNSWLTESKEFLSWSTAEDLDCNILWCHGKPGSGKTVLASSAISMGQSMCKGDTSIGMAYFYLKFDDPQRHTASSVRRALCDQLLSELPEKTRIDVVTAFTNSGRREISSESQITALIFDIGEWFSRVLIFVDGLDECVGEDLQGLLSFLCKLPRHFRILAFSRERAEIRQGLSRCTELPLSIHNPRNEIRDFITSQVHTSLTTRDESLRNETVHILTDKADGMWLWVALQIKTLRHCNTDADIRAALHDLPPDLDTSYYRILMRIDGLPGRAPKQVRHALRWLVGTLRPLHLDELAQAVALSAFDEDEPGAEYSPINDSKLLLEHCLDLCMMTYPKENRVVQLIHASVRDYLVTSPTELRNSIPDYHITSLPSLHLHLARVCLTHVQRAQDVVMARSNLNSEPYFAYARESYLCDHLKAVVPHIDKSLENAYLKLLEALSNRAQRYDDYFPNFFPALGAIVDSLALALTLKTDDIPQRLRLAELFCDLHACYIIAMGSSHDASFKKAAQTIYRDIVDTDGVTQLCITKGRANILYCEFAVAGGDSSLEKAITLLEEPLLEGPKDDPTRYGFVYPLAQYRRDMFVYNGDLEGLTSVLHIYAEAYEHAGDNDVRIKCLQGMIDTILAVMLLGPESVKPSVTVEANVTRIKEQLRNVPEGARRLGDHLILLQTIEQIIDDHENYYPTWYIVTDILRTRPPHFFNLALAILSTFRGACDVDLDIHQRCQHGLYHLDGIYISLVRLLEEAPINRRHHSDAIWDVFFLGVLPRELEYYFGAYIASRLLWLGIRFDVLRTLPQLGQASARRALTQERISDALEILEATQSLIFSPESSLRAVFDHLPESRAKKMVLYPSHTRHLDIILDELDGVLKTPSLQSAVLDAMAHINGHIVVLVPDDDSESCQVVIAKNGEDFRQLHLHIKRTMWHLLQISLQSGIKNVNNLTMRGTMDHVRLAEMNTCSAISKTLWLELVQPIFNALSISEPTLSDLPHITWYPTGSLVNLPFHSAGLYGYSESRDRTYRHVISSYALSFSSACQASPPTVTSGDHTRFLVISQTSSFASPPFIPETVTEADIITRAIGGSSTGLNEKKATVNRVLAEMEQSNWVHFACHASEHGFHLYDGRLQPQTIMRKSYTNARLAYLSACGTDESSSRRRMFSRSHAEVMSMAGFRTVIAAMSPIADRDARIVAAKFYEYMFSGPGPEGKSAAVALHLAVAHLRERIGENDPNNVERWAPFIHIGL